MSRNKEFFYVICHDGQIIEVEYTEQRIKAFVDAKQTKGTVAIQNKGYFLGGESISKVLNADVYDSYIISTGKKVWIKNGAWRDKGGIIKYEKWRELEIEQAKQKALKPAETKLSDKQLKKIESIRKEISKKFKVGGVK